MYVGLASFAPLEKNRSLDGYYLLCHTIPSPVFATQSIVLILSLS